MISKDEFEKAAQEAFRNAALEMKAVSEYALERLSSKAYEVWQRNGKFD